MCSHDVLSELRREEVLHGRPTEGNLLTRLPKYLVEQRHFFPLYPPTARANLPRPPYENGLATGAMLDLPYMKLGEWWNVRPDILIVPSMLPPFVKVRTISGSNPKTLDCANKALRSLTVCWSLTQVPCRNVAQQAHIPRWPSTHV
jgi:DNA polymerase alpha subunit B